MTAIPVTGAGGGISAPSIASGSATQEETAPLLVSGKEQPKAHTEKLQRFATLSLSDNDEEQQQVISATLQALTD